MASFVVLMHDDVPTAKALEKTVFVRDAFSLVALAFPILWLFWYRLWSFGFGALALFVAIGFFAAEHVQYAWLPMLFSVFFSFFIAIEGPALRMVALRASGYKDRAIIEAENLELAQLKWVLTGKPEAPKRANDLQTQPQTKHDSDLIFSTNGKS